MPSLIPSFNKDRNTKIPIKVKHDYFKTHFLLLLYQSGTSLNSTLETQQAPVLLKQSF